jgi:hypothetical protein
MGRLQWNTNYTWSREITYLLNPTLSPYSQWIDPKITKNVANRNHAINVNFGYDIPNGSQLWRNAFTRQVLDGWRISGGFAIFSGLPMTVACSAQNQTPGYWTGTPTGGIPFRCQMGNDMFLPSGQVPSKTEDPRLQIAFNSANFVLPPANSLGIGNTPPTLMYGPWLVNADSSLAKDFRIKEGKTLELRVETFNTFNHFNPSNPTTANLTLNYNFATGAQTNSSFGVINSSQVQARRAILSARFRF